MPHNTPNKNTTNLFKYDEKITEHNRIDLTELTNAEQWTMMCVSRDEIGNGLNYSSFAFECSANRSTNHPRSNISSPFQLVEHRRTCHISLLLCLRAKSIAVWRQ